MNVETANMIEIGGRRVVVPKDRNDYWKARREHDLYRITTCLAESMFADAKSCIDVGCYVGGLICEFDWIERRVASDIQPLMPHWAHVRDVEFVQGDAFAIDFKEPFDLVMSQQTVEHLDRPAEFIEKLISLGRGLIVSTTYEVPPGTIEGHVQDPISLEKFKSWFPCELDAWVICHHPTSRMLKHVIGVVKRSHPARKRG